MKAFVVVALLFSLPTLAADIKMLEAKSDVDGEMNSVISIQVKSDTTIQNVIYANPSQPAEMYSIKDLNEDKQTVVKKSGVAVVEISAESLSKNSAIFNIHYLYKYSLFGSDRRVKKLKMYYVAPTNLYETMDMDTKQVVTQLLFVVRMDGGKQKGIDHIETYP